MIQVSHHTISARRTIFGSIICLFAVGILLVASTVRANDDAPLAEGARLITLYDRGEERVFATNASTVGEALDGAGVVLDDSDAVEPARGEELIAKEYSVNIYRARPIVVVDGQARQAVISSEQTPEKIADQAGVTLYPEDRADIMQSRDLLVDGAALQLVIDRATPFTLTLYGETITARSQAATVGEFLEEKDIVLGENDRASLPLSTPITADMKLRIWREGKQTITVDEVIPFETEQIQDANREVGYKDIRTVGVNGEASVTYEVTIQDGKEVKREKIASVTKRGAVKQVEVVGAKFNYTGGPLSEAQMNALGTCESGMTANRNSGNGFYGAFQFMPATWNSVAPDGYKGALPHTAPLDVQKQAVQNLLSRSSIYSQFPSCARQMQASGIL